MLSGVLNLMKKRSIRLNRFLALSGLCSRRSADRLIAGGRVTVNGHTCTELSTRIDPENDSVALDGRRLMPREGLIYIALNKPRGYITTMRDERGRKCVKDLIRGLNERVFPVGRLDKESEGLLLFTNDGITAHRLMHPSFGVRKVYRVTLDREPIQSELERLTEGVELDDGPARALKAKLVSPGGRVVELVVEEGRKREIRRIFKEIGIGVLRLRRTRFGPVALGSLRAGSWRSLKEQEISGILDSVRTE